MLKVEVGYLLWQMNISGEKFNVLGKHEGIRGAYVEGILEIQCIKKTEHL